MPDRAPGSDYDRLIPPEIRNDAFYAAILRLASATKARHILEIGSSSGQGSTEAFVLGIRQNPTKPTLHCIEISKPRYDALRDRYRADSFVKPHNVSSVGPQRFPSEAEVCRFHEQYLAGRFAPIAEVLRWLRQDLDYIQQSNVPHDGIAQIKREHAVQQFDIVLIDGSEFTGKPELEEVYGARWILLDDINSFKNHENFHRLLRDPRYLLHEANPNLRGGYAIFEQIYRDQPASTEHESAERRLVLKRIRPGMTIIDLGANVGDYTILFSRFAGPTGRILALEPSPSTAATLRTRLTAHECENVEVIEAAAWSSNAPLEFHEFGDDLSAWNTIGQPTMTHPSDPSRMAPIQRTQVVQGLTLDEICEARGIHQIDFLKVDVEGAEADALAGARKLLSRYAIRTIQFEVSSAMLKGMSRNARDTFQLLESHGYECRRINPDGTAGEVAHDSDSFYENYVAFPTLPLHLFTLVLNGQPFIRHHINQFLQLPFDWHWHIIEGVAELKHDTAWSLATGGRIPAALHRDGRSIDGTSEYLDQLEDRYPDRVTVYRKPPGQFWDGKLEMVNQPLNSIPHECLLFEIDADELWTATQLIAARDLFLRDPSKTAAMYWCWFFVGPDRLISTRNGYANNPRMEWLRTWRYRPGMRWAAHEPPILVEPVAGGWRPVHAVNPILHPQTEAAGLVFQHYAYATEPQVRFKQDYYGYDGATERWQALQALEDLPAKLRDFFPWVQDETQVDLAKHYVARPLIQLPPADLGPYVQAQRTELPIADCRLPIKEKVAGHRETQGQRLADAPNSALATRNSESETPPSGLSTQHSALSSQSAIGNRQSAIPLQSAILIDCVFFQYYRTGIARVWTSLLEEWLRTGWAHRLLLIDRAGTMPKLPGLAYIAAPRHDYARLDEDQALLSRLAQRHRADLFMSTYYSSPLTPASPSCLPEILIIHDMIPELFAWDLSHPMWQEKHRAIHRATTLVCVSHATARDLRRVFPDIPREKILVAPLAAARVFYPRPGREIDQLRAATGLTKPYFLLVGARGGYKNTLLTFRALAQLPDLDRFELLCAGHTTLEDEYRRLVPTLRVRSFHLSDDELAAAYSGAVALLHPSTYEGFGLPVLEAMACGCPVITTKNGSLAEVAGDAALFVSDSDPASMVAAIARVQRLEIRHDLMNAGREQAQKFSWQTFAATIRHEIEEVTSSVVSPSSR